MAFKKLEMKRSMHFADLALVLVYILRYQKKRNARSAAAIASAALVAESADDEEEFNGKPVQRDTRDDLDRGTDKDQRDESSRASGTSSTFFLGSGGSFGSDASSSFFGSEAGGKRRAADLRKDSARFEWRLYAACVCSEVLNHFAENRKALEGPLTERFYCSILWVDLSGFTKLSERLGKEGTLGLEKLAETLNFYFSKIILQIIAYGGDVLKFCGDGWL